MPVSKLTNEENLTQIKQFRGKPNGGIIKIILHDRSTVIGMFKNIIFSSNGNVGAIELTNGQKIDYKEIDRIV